MREGFFSSMLTLSTLSSPMEAKMLGLAPFPGDRRTAKK